MDLVKIVRSFDVKGVIRGIYPIITGNINRTYSVVMDEDGIEKKYILQKINSHVFKEPYNVMQNICKVTEFLRNKSTYDKEPLIVLKTKDGDPMYVCFDESSEKVYYRMYNQIKNSITYDTVSDKHIIYEAGRAFGKFTKDLDGFEEELFETIPNFHNTKKRFDDLIDIYDSDPIGRAKQVTEEMEYLISVSKKASILNLYSFPTRVTHNDTKINNVMFDKTTGDFITVIDLDTVMKGNILFDYGDAIRSIASTAPEDEEDLSKVQFNFEAFQYFTCGFLYEAGKILTPNELLVLGKSIFILTFELAVRFLTDFLNGDTYFYTDPTKPNHNLIRARNQIKLMKEIYTKEDNIETFICFISSRIS